MKRCPMCKKMTMDDKITRNALSRKDNKTYVCPQCGMMQAIMEYSKK